LPLHPGRARARLFTRMTRLAREIATHIVADRGPEEILRGIEHELGVYSQGGKGTTLRKTPVEIRERCDRLALDPGPLIYASRMVAKVDSAAVQDGYQLYHHASFFRRQAIGASSSKE
jgi:hypothetical protein